MEMIQSYEAYSRTIVDWVEEEAAVKVESGHDGILANVLTEDGDDVSMK